MKTKLMTTPIQQLFKKYDVNNDFFLLFNL